MSRIYENGRINWNAMRESQGVERRLEALHLGGGESSTSKRTSNLPQEVRNFLKLIANTENMVEAVVSLKFDINSSFGMLEQMTVVELYFRREEHRKGI